MFRCALIATMLVSGVYSFAEATQLPKQFMGVWMVENSGNKNCTRQDWKGDTVDSGLPIYFIEPKKITGVEYGCQLLSVRPDPNLLGSIVAQFKCGGEGFDWQETQGLSIRKTAGKSRLVQVTSQHGPAHLQISEFKYKTVQMGKLPRKTDIRAATTIYQQCP